MSCPPPPFTAQRRVNNVSLHINPDMKPPLENHLTKRDTSSTKPKSKKRKPESKLFRFKFDRRPIKIPVHEVTTEWDRHGGVAGLNILEAELLVPSSSPPVSQCSVVVFMHPSAVMTVLPMCVALARSGMHVITANSRYANNDSNLSMEKVLLDVGAVVSKCRSLGYKHVVLAGWSAGGSLMCYYQSEAQALYSREEKKESNALPLADALVVIAAHKSRSAILTDFLDPSIFLLRRGDYPQEEQSLQKFNLYSSSAPGPPFSPQFLEEFRDAQIARSRRITEWARDRLTSGSNDCFVVDGTMSDPRWLDLSVDPNQRTRVNYCFQGEPKIANNAPTGLARFCTVKSWLSQWSLESQACGVSHLARVKCPVLVIENGADDAVPRSHLQQLFHCISHADKEYKVIEHANHYYIEQPEKQAEAAATIIDWLNRHSLASVSLPASVNFPDTTQAHAPKMQITELQQRYGQLGGTAKTAEVPFYMQGLNHLALVSSDMDRTVRFYGDVLGMKLLKTISLAGDAQHFFFDVGRGESLAYFYFPDAKPPVRGVSSPDLVKGIPGPSAPGSMNHVAFNVPESRIPEYRDRLIKAKTGWVSPIMYHADTPIGYEATKTEKVTWVSVYFFGPDDELLEITSQQKGFADVISNVQHVPRRALHLSAD